MAEALYDIPLDGSVFDLFAPFKVKTLVFVNGSNVNVSVTDDTGRAFTIGAGDGGPVPVLGVNHFALKASAQASSGSAYVIASDKRLPGSVGALTSPTGGGTASVVKVADAGGVNELAVDASGHIGLNNFPASQAVTAAAGAIADLAHGQGTMAQSVPVTIASNQSAIATNPAVNTGGGQANLWNAAVTGAGGNSTAVGFASQHFAAVFGHVSAATTISLQYSADDINFYTVAQSVLTGAGDFAFTNLIIPAGIVIRLQSSASVTATATVLGSS